MKTSTRRIAAVAALATAAFVAAACAGAGAPGPATAAEATQGSQGSMLGITVTGTGSAKAAPDQASFSFGVETQGTTADDALGANNAAVEKVIEAIKDAGIDDKDIQTQSVSVYPRYSSDGQAIIGYTASNSVAVVIGDLDKVGAVVEAATAAGANQVSGPSLTISDRSKLYTDAIDEAFADARSKAEAIAAAAEVTLGPVVNVVEGGGVMPIAVAEASVADGGAGVPIEPGQQEVQAILTVTFSIG